MATNPPGKSIPMEISLKAMVDAYADITFEKPIKLVSKTMDALEKLASRRHIRTGPMAALTLPVSIMLRFAAKGGKIFSPRGGGAFAGFMASLGTMGTGGWLAGKAAFTMLGTTSAMAGMPALITGGAAAVITAPLLLPMAAIGIIGTSLLAAALGMQLGLLPAVANIAVGISRSRDYFKGIRNQSYGEVFSDDPPAPSTTTAAVLSPIEEEFSFKPKKQPAPDFNHEAAVQLGKDITYKKIKLKIRVPAA